MAVTMPDESLRALNAAVQDVWHERMRQVKKWGEQHHPDLVMADVRQDFVELAELWKKRNGDATADWTGILLEEVFEALAEPESSAELEAELIQVAAVAAAWVEDIRSRRAG